MYSRKAAIIVFLDGQYGIIVGDHEFIVWHFRILLNVLKPAIQRESRPPEVRPRCFRIYIYIYMDQALSASRRRRDRRRRFRRRRTRRRGVSSCNKAKYKKTFEHICKCIEKIEICEPRHRCARDTKHSCREKAEACIDKEDSLTEDCRSYCYTEVDTDLQGCNAKLIEVGAANKSIDKDYLHDIEANVSTINERTAAQDQGEANSLDESLSGKRTCR